VLAPLHGNYQQANMQVARIVARYPRRLIGSPSSTRNAMPAEFSKW